MTEAEIKVLLALLIEDEGPSVPKVAKRMGLGQSQLLRILSALGPDPIVGGLGLVQVRGEEPKRIFLTTAGREWMRVRHEA